MVTPDRCGVDFAAPRAVQSLRHRPLESCISIAAPSGNDASPESETEGHIVRPGGGQLTVITRDRIINTVYRAIDEVNEALAPRNRLEKALETHLIGATSKLDSLGLVNLALTLEEKLEREFGKAVPLGRLLSRDPEDSPFRRVDTLVEHIHSFVSAAA